VRPGAEAGVQSVMRVDSFQMPHGRMGLENKDTLPSQAFLL